MTLVPNATLSIQCDESWWKTYVGGYEVTRWCSAGLSLHSGLWVTIVSPGQAASDKKQIQTLALASASGWPLGSGLAELTSRRIVPVFSRFMDLNGET